MGKKRHILSIFFLCLSFIWIDYMPCHASEENSIANKAFKQSLQSYVPLSPEQIEQLQNRMQETNEAVHSAPPPKMSNRTRRFVLDPGHEPPVLKVAPGYVSSIAFFDVTGEPWPVTSIVVGNPSYYNVQKPKDLKPGNMLIITALKKHVDSNIVLTLQGHDMPMTIQLETIDRKKEAVTDATIAFQANKRGPLAKEPQIGPELDPTVDNTMLSFLDGVPPSSAKHKIVTPAIEGVHLWSYQKSYFLRTKYSVVWPAWVSIVKGVGGVNVYKFSKKTPSVMLSKNGKTVSLKVENDG